MQQVSDLSRYLDQLRVQIEESLISASTFSDQCPPKLLEAIRYSLLAPGKRVRPCLALMACDACGQPAEKAIPAAISLEMIHCYSLIHDDLPAMDDDDLRRGRPTNHIEFGEATAILAGDALLTRAFEVLALGIEEPDIAVACISELASAAGAEGMVGGQQADLEAETRTITDPDELQGIHRRKTGHLLAASLLMGGRIARADDETLECLKIYGESVGLAFQIADDLLDVVGDSAKMGKHVQKDADHGKSTYPGLLGIETSRLKASQLIDQACDAVSCFGEQGQHLIDLAKYLIERDH
ncbi:Farnesyl diphosphate synthase [Thalassoglobus neptunius]|uniref:Farnesyl diphosphate synthase n=1 Tax=Thalassoglobus neptunius TaxID=1938619 RepID=A0A5C5X6S1_9PLAN|nr:farnesyl diphosphate synthase [Thalassoglobus neptunius]TWT58041.1 Farnesyl diphosphate synthase [Thalassoglobus neptunius]